MSKVIKNPVVAGGKYRLISKSMTDDSSIWYRAICNEDDQLVTIIHFFKLFDSIQSIKSAQREISILSKLCHPGIGNIIEILVPHDLESANEVFVITEYSRS